MRAVRGILISACCLALLIALSPPPATRADEADVALEKYNKPIDEALENALTYLAKAQQPDGGWPSGSLGKSTAVASLSVMAFLAKGYSPGTGPFGETINKGIDFVLRTQKPNGLLVEGTSHGPMYDHAISTLMLSEVSGMVDAQRQQRLDKALAPALKLILTAQQVAKPAHFAGGWRYQAHSPDSDISCTGWALMALRSARNNGAQVPKEAIDKAVKFVLACRDPAAAAKPNDPKKGVGFLYQPPQGQPGLARTGTAVLCLELCGQHRSKETLAGGDWILANLPKSFGDQFFYYALYYCSQATFQLGGQYWEKFAPHMYEMMLKHQKPDGSWPQAANNESAAGVCYSTAMGVLAISVSYRQLPIYQR